MSKVITALCKSRAATENALRQLEAAGFNDSQISILLSDQTRGRAFSLVEQNKMEEGAAAGAGIGGIVGGLLAVAAGTGALVFPGLNIVVAGYLISGLAGVGAGAATGGLLGALVGSGIPEHEAKLYEKELSKDSILIAVKTETSEQAQQVERILKSVDAANIAA